jgi:hypothetical protein
MKNELRLCGDCGVEPGQPHQDGCDVERCSVCGNQRLSCACKKGRDKYFARWTGIWPGEIEANYLGLDLNEFYIQGFEKIFFIKPKVSQDDYLIIRRN